MSRDSKEFIILSLGQIITTDISKTIEAFAAIVEEQKARGCCGFKSSKSTVESALLWDRAPFIGSGTIEKYKIGAITLEEFHERIDKQLGIKTSKEQFKDAWNAMCKVSDEDVTKFRDLLNLKVTHGIELCVFSHTDELHHSCIMRQLRANHINHTVTTSYNEETADLNKLAFRSMHEKYSSGSKIISLHNKVSDPEHDLFKGKNFTCRPVDSREENIVEAVRSLTQAQRIPAAPPVQRPGMHTIIEMLSLEDDIRPYRYASPVRANVYVNSNDQRCALWADEVIKMGNIPQAIRR